MPIDNSIVHQIHKKPDGQPATLTLREAELASSQALEQLLAGLIEAYNSKPNKAWGYFHEESGAYPFSGWLQQLIDQELDFVRFSSQATEHLKTLMEGSNLALGGHVLYIRYRQGMTAFLVIALLHHTEGVTVTDELDVAAARHLDLSSLNMAARINLTEWKQNASAKNYISFIRGRSGKRVSDYFRDFIGCVEGANPEEETNTLLQAFSAYVGEASLEPELVKDKATRERFPDKGTVGTLCRDLCVANGLVMRAVGDTMIMSPPLVISRSEIDELVDKAWKVLDQVAEQLGV